MVRIYQAVASAAGLLLKTRHFINTLQNQPNNNKEATQSPVWCWSDENCENQRMCGRFHSGRTPEQLRDRGGRAGTLTCVLCWKEIDLFLHRRKNIQIGLFSWANCCWGTLRICVSILSHRWHEERHILMAWGDPQINSFNLPASIERCLSKQCDSNPGINLTLPHLQKLFLWALFTRTIRKAACCCHLSTSDDFDNCFCS